VKPEKARERQLIFDGIDMIYKMDESSELASFLILFIL